MKLAGIAEKMHVEITPKSKSELDIIHFVVALLSLKCSNLSISLGESNACISLGQAEKMIQVHFVE